MQVKTSNYKKKRKEKEWELFFPPFSFVFRTWPGRAIFKPTHKDSPPQRWRPPCPNAESGQRLGQPTSRIIARSVPIDSSLSSVSLSIRLYICGNIHRPPSLPRKNKRRRRNQSVNRSKPKKKEMGNCLRRESSTDWGGEDWGSALVTEKVGNSSNPENERLLGDRKACSSGTEMKIKITKKELEKLIGCGELQGLSVDQILSRLINASDHCELHHQQSWRPALRSIPEVNWVGSSWWWSMAWRTIWWPN